MNNKALLFSLVGLIVLTGIFGVVYPKPITQVIEKLGGSGPEWNVPFWSINGVTSFYNRTQQFAQATTSVCYQLSPKATSTLSASITLNEASTTPLFVELFRVANDQTFATSSGTQIGSTMALKADADEVNLGFGNHIVASTTDGGGLGAIFPPNTMALVKIYSEETEADEAGKTDGGVSLDGACNFVWDQF